MANNTFNTPILMLVFNRPDETQQVFNAIKQIKPAKLYVAADGPRENRISDRELSTKTREIFKQIDWQCELKTLYREKNMGCGPAVSSAITWFFENEEMGIILEDDCVPDVTFFSFCETLLAKYKDNNEIMHIGGSNFQQGIKRGEASYYFSLFSHVWGWATWRRAWAHYDFNLNTINNIGDIDLSFFTKNKGIKRYWQLNLLYSKKGIINTWDYQWSLTVLKMKGLSIIPNSNLVKNIGNTDNSAHSSSKDTSWMVNQNTTPLKEIVFANNIQINTDADDYFYDKAVKPNNSIPQKIVKTIRLIKMMLK